MITESRIFLLESSGFENPLSRIRILITSFLRIAYFSNYFSLVSTGSLAAIRLWCGARRGASALFRSLAVISKTLNPYAFYTEYCAARYFFTSHIVLFCWLYVKMYDGERCERYFLRASSTLWIVSKMSSR